MSTSSNVLKLVFGVFLILYVTLVLNSPLWYSHTDVVIAMGGAMILLNLDIWFWTNEKPLFSNIAQSLVYSIFFVSLDGEYAIKFILLFVILHLLAYEPKVFEPRLLIDSKTSFIWAFALVLLHYLLDGLGLPTGVVTDEEFPESTRFLRNFYFALAMAALFHHVLRGKMAVISRRLAEQQRGWSADLLNLIAHNVRTPLGSLSNRIQIVRLKVGKGLAVSAADAEAMQRDNDRVLAIVHQLLDKSAKQTKDPKIKVKRLSTILDEANYDRLVILNPKMIEFKLSITFALTLELCLDSLVRNALKYSENEVSIEIMEHQGNYIVQVKDSGIGMSPEEVARYGTPFIDNKVDKGSGLGVYMVLQLAKSQGWDWTVRSHLGKGTSTRIIIPKSKLFWTS